jgi:ornithine carbamoyltransferase
VVDRCAFEVAAAQQGARTTYLGPQDTHLGHKESARDTARVLGRMYDAIEYRGFAQATAVELAEHSSRTSRGAACGCARAW